MTNYITTKDGTQIYYKDWGNRAACCFQSRLAPQRGRLGRPDVLSRLARLPLHRPRPARTRTLQPALERQRHGHLCR